MAAKALGNDSAGILYTDRRDFYLSPNMTKELWPTATPFTTIISNRSQISIADPDFKMFEHRSGWIKQQVAANASSGWTSNGGPGGTISGLAVNALTGLATSVDSSYIGLQFEIWDATLATYKGTCFVTAVGSGVITIKSLGNPGASDFINADIVSGDILQVIGNVSGEGTEAPEAWSDDLSVVYNSPQIFKTPVEVTGTLYNMALRGYSNELARLRMEKQFEHQMQKERAFLFGVRSGGIGVSGYTDYHGGTGTSGAHQLDANGNVSRTTMGIVSALQRYGVASGDSQNKFTIDAASYAYSNFVDDMEKVFQYIPTSGSKTALVGAKALSYWSKVDATNGFVKKSGFQVNLESTQRDSLGFNFRTLETPHGILKLVYTPALRGPWANRMVIIDESDVSHVVFRPMVYKTNIKTDNAYDGVKDLYMSDEGVGLTMLEKHSLWTINQ